MSIKTSTWKERKEIYKLLEDNGYKMYRNYSVRGDREFQDFGLYLHTDGDWILGDTSAKVYTYQEMKSLILGEEQQYEIY